MKIESYYMMKTTFEIYKSYTFNKLMAGIGDERIYIIYFDKLLDCLCAGWMKPEQVNNCQAIHIILNNDEYENFNEKIYNEKVNLLTKKVKAYYVKKKLQDLESDFICI